MNLTGILMALQNEIASSGPWSISLVSSAFGETSPISSGSVSTVWDRIKLIITLQTSAYVEQERST